MNPSKAKGTAAETAIVRFLNENGYPHVERRAGAGAQDRGDIAGLPGIVIEVKNKQAMDLAGWLREATLEAIRDRSIPIVWHKRRGVGSPGHWYVTMDGWAFLALLERWTDDTAHA